MWNGWGLQPNVGLERKNRRELGGTEVQIVKVRLEPLFDGNEEEVR